MDDANRSLAALELALQTGGTATVVVNGRSMLPFVFPGARLRVVKATPDDVEVGDVVVVVRAGQAVVHRVVERTGEGLRTRGDAFRRADESVEGERLIARVVGLALFRRSHALPDALARPLGRLVAEHGTKLLDPLFAALGVARTTLYRARRRVPGLVERRRRAVALRTATGADHGLVQAHFRRRGIAGGHGIERPGSDPDHRIVLACRGPRVVGSVSILRDDEGDGVLFYDLHVEAASRGLGLGTLLVRAALDEAARSFPGRRALAEIRVTNVASKTCFGRAGFELESVVDDVETWVHGPRRGTEVGRAPR